MWPPFGGSTRSGPSQRKRRACLDLTGRSDYSAVTLASREHFNQDNSADDASTDSPNSIKSGRAFRQLCGVARTKKELGALLSAQNCLQLHDSNEGDEHHEQDQSKSEDALQGPAPQVGDALPKGFVVIQAEGSLLENLKGSHRDSKHR